MMEQLMELNQGHKEYYMNFVKQQELLVEEIRKLDNEGHLIRQEIKKIM